MPDDDDKPWVIRWLTTTEAHAWPHRDLIDHESADCICGPDRRPIINTTTREIAGWMHIHHSLDGREQEPS